MTISGGGHSGVFQVEEGVTATLTGLTITGGNNGQVANHGVATAQRFYDQRQFHDLSVAGVYNSGTAMLNGCTISGNSAGNGGGVVNTGTATLNGCTISGNAATYGGGGLANAVRATLNDCTIGGNSRT